MKRYITCLLLIIAFTFSISGIAAETSVESVFDGIAAIVNKDIITFSEVNEACEAETKALKSQLEKKLLDKKTYRTKFRALTWETLQRLIDGKLNVGADTKSAPVSAEINATLRKSAYIQIWIVKPDSL